jgi:hypothetical protein
MKRRSPTLEGFRVMLRLPSFGLAEIAWRWSLGAGAGLLLAFSLVEYFDTLPVTRGDLVLLRSSQPSLVSQAIAHIFRNSGFRVVETAIVLAMTAAFAWVVIGTLARAATIKSLIAYFRENFGTSDIAAAQPSNPPARSNLTSLFGLNCFRVAVTVAATVGCFAAFLLAAAATSPEHPAPGSAFLIFLTVIMLVWLAWSTVSWLLSLAAVFAVTRGEDTFGSIAAAVELCRIRAGSIFAAGTWFGLAHVTAFVVASSVVAFPLAFAEVLPAGVVLGGVLLVSLLYFAVADFLYMGRLAAYVAMIELPELPEVSPEPAPSIQLRSGIDPDELILSDVPAES